MGCLNILAGDNHCALKELIYRFTL